MLEQRRFLTDWFANLSSLVLLAFSGLLINSLIAKVHGAAALGVFNQTFAIYILGSQLATFGVQFSVLRYIAEFDKDRRLSASILSAALLVAVVAASGVVAVIAVLLLGAGHYLYSESVVASVPFMLPGLWAFAVNKVFLNALNGAQRNKLYALFTSVRYLLLSLSAVIAIVAQLPIHQLSVILSASEVVLMLLLAVSCQRIFPGYLSTATRSWINRHARFGLRSILGGVAVEMNTRVDVLILGLFTSDSAVGIYSFAAFFVEGILQLPLLARRIVDPVLTTLVVAGDRGRLAAFVCKGRNLSAVLMVLVSVAAVLLYPFYARVLADSEIADRSWSVFAILMTGACVFGAYATFSGLFLQAGLPTAQTQLNVLILLVNTAFNFMLAPFYGVHGAAIATSVSFVAGTLFFRHWVWRHFGFRL